MEITEVRINLNKGGRVRAFAQVVFDGCFLLGDIRVLEGKDGITTVAMPSRRLRNGSFREIAHPLNQETRQRLEDTVLEEFRRVLLEQGDPNGASTRTQQISARYLGEKFWTEEDEE